MKKKAYKCLCILNFKMKRFKIIKKKTFIFNFTFILLSDCNDFSSICSLTITILFFEKTRSIYKLQDTQMLLNLINHRKKLKKTLFNVS